MTRCRYEEIAPAAELRRHVLSYWRFSCELAPGETFRHHVWPDGCVSISFFGPAEAREARISGPDLRARMIDIVRTTVFAGIRFWPDIGGAAMGIAAPQLRGRSVPLEEEGLPGEIEDFDAFLLRRGVPAFEILEPVRHVVEALIGRGGSGRTSELAAIAGWTSRNLQRRFRERVGLTPKEFARIRRVRSVIGEILDGRRSWSDVAGDHGYADQAHMARDLAAITGFAPTAVEERLMAIEHANVTP